MNIVDAQISKFYFQWHINEVCNLRCLHCYQKDYRHKGYSSGDLIRVAETMEKTLYAWSRSGRISLTGGEPFLNPDSVFLLLDFFDSSNAFSWIGILTNGTLISEEISYKLSQYKKLREVQISLDGSSSHIHDKVRGRNSFDMAIRGIKLLRKEKIPTSIMFTLTNMNKHDALKVIDLAVEIGASAITIERAIPNAQSTDVSQYVPPAELETIYSEIYKKKVEFEKRFTIRIRTSRPLWCLISDNIGGFCPAGLSCLAILHDGTVLPCRRLEIPLGNILIDGIFKIWYTSTVLWHLRDKNHLHKECRTCTHIANCGGCRAMAYAITGDYMAKDPQCWKHNQKNLRKC